MSGAELYRLMVEYVEQNGWRREEAGSGWWFHPDGMDDTIGRAVEEQFLRENIDTRYPPQTTPGPGADA